MENNTKELLFEIAKIVSNEYAPLRDTFNPVRKGRHYYISTKVCDTAPAIKVYCDPLVQDVFRVEVNGDYTEGWQLVHHRTMERIDDLFNPTPAT